jgi:general stress protein 26
VNLSYVDADSHRYVSVSGRATLSRDHQKMATLWTPAHRTFFPQGLDDPDIALLRIDVDSAEYWDSPGGMLVRLVGFMTALAGRTQAPGESHKLEIPGKTARV